MSLSTCLLSCSCRWQWRSRWCRWPSRGCSRRAPTPTKNDTYECGLTSKGDAWVQFRVGYYIYALIYVIFAVETVFLYPWAVAFAGLSFGAFIAMMVFVLLLVEGLVYAWAKGALDWK